MDGAFQLADHRPDPSSLDQPLPCARFPDTAGVAHQLIVLARTPHHHPADAERTEYDRADARRQIHKCLIAMSRRRRAPIWRALVRHCRNLPSTGWAGGAPGHPERGPPQGSPYGPRHGRHRGLEAPRNRTEAVTMPAATGVAKVACEGRAGIKFAAPIADPLEPSQSSLVQSRTLTMSDALWSLRSSLSLAQPVSSANVLFAACMNTGVPCGSRRDTQVRPERCSGPTIRDFGLSMAIYDPGNQWPMRSLARAEW